jgi:light-regulated signal transduction histidine kinase (bacteriophytochrome)
MREEQQSLSLTKRLPAVFGDAERIAHVLQNLLLNSTKYRRKSSLCVQVTATQKNGTCAICVQDNGIGFEQRQAGHLLGSLKRLHRDEYAGTGVSLALAKQVVEQHGGRIWAPWEPGVGARYYFSLPTVTRS